MCVRMLGRDCETVYMKWEQVRERIEQEVVVVVVGWAQSEAEKWGMKE